MHTLPEREGPTSHFFNNEFNVLLMIKFNICDSSRDEVAEDVKLQSAYCLPVTDKVMLCKA